MATGDVDTEYVDRVRADRTDDLVGLIGEGVQGPAEPVVVEQVRVDVVDLSSTAHACAQSATATIAFGLVSRWPINYTNHQTRPGHTHGRADLHHLIRDCTDAAETYPDAHWPIQIREALQGLVHAANLARAQNLPAIPGTSRTR
jgi:hypothetical protein